MTLGLGWIWRSWDRDPKKNKRIVGFKFDIRMRPRDTETFQEWCRVEEAYYIPSNERDRLRLDFAEEMGLRVKIGSIVDIDWIMIESDEGGEGDIPHNSPHNSFLVESKLPCKVMFGKQTPQTSLPENQYLPVFEMATKTELDRSYDFSKRRANTWEKVNTKISRRTSTWMSRSERKNNSGLSFFQRKVQAQSPVRSAALNTRINPEAPVLNSFAQSALGGMATSSNENPKYQHHEVSGKNLLLCDNAPKTPAKPFTVGAQRDEENPGLKCQNLEGFNNENAKNQDATDYVVCARQQMCGQPSFSSGQATPFISEHGNKSGSVPESCEAGESNDAKLRSFQMERQDRLLGSDSGVGFEHSKKNSILPEPRSYGYGAYGAIQGYRELGRDSTPEVVSNLIADNTDHLRSLEEAQAKIRARKRGKAPKIRRVKVDKTQVLQSVDSTSVPEIHEDWVYDPAARGYYKVDFDTGSRIWYEDSDSEDFNE